MIDATRARKLLEAERQRLAGIHAQADDNLSDSLTDSSGELSSFDQHPGDVATETVEREQDDSLREHAAAELEEIDAAMARLEAGTYGACERCGIQIPEERLAIRPHTRFCVEHQRDRERAQEAGRQVAPLSTPGD